MRQVKISYFHKVLGPNGPVPNYLKFSFEDMIREFAAPDIGKLVPLGKFQLNLFINLEPRFDVRHLSTRQTSLADRESAWIYEICSSQGFIKHAELSQDEFWGSIWDSVPLIAQNEIRRGAMHFLISSLIEDSTPRSIIKIISSLKAVNAPEKNISICSGGLYSHRAMKEVFDATGWSIQTVPSFECGVLADERNGNRITRQFPFRDSVRPSKRFVFLNRRINHVPHRIAAFLALLELKLENFGHISMTWKDLSNPELTFRDRISDLYMLPDSINRNRLFEFGREYFKYGPGCLPLKLDVDFADNAVRRFQTVDHFSKTLHQYYDDSYFSIVPECRYNYGGENELDAPAVLSEKTFFAIRNYHPFIIMGEPYSLRRLRDHGYQTFSSWIDESYDLILDPAERALAVARVVESLCRIPESDLRKIVLEMEPTLRHNHARVQERVDQSVQNATRLIERQLRVRV